MELQRFISGCIAVEETTAFIYRIFMDLFPDEKLFWQELYRDELEHSFWLSSASHAEAIDLLPSTITLPSVKLIRHTLAFIEGKVRHVRSNPVVLEEALRTALKIEESMVEIFTNEMSANLLATDTQSLNDKLIAAEKLHISKIEDMMISRGFLQLT